MSPAPFRFTSPLETVSAGVSVVPSSGWIDLTAKLAAGYTYYKLGIDTSLYTSADLIDVRVEFTGDNGATVFAGCGFTTIGGPHTDRHGTPMFPWCGALLPAPGPNGLKARLRITVPAGSLKVEVELD